MKVFKLPKSKLFDEIDMSKLTIKSKQYSIWHDFIHCLLHTSKYILTESNFSDNEGKLIDIKE